jgi:hypothetical protein
MANIAAIDNNLKLKIFSSLNIIIKYSDIKRSGLGDSFLNIDLNTTSLSKYLF